MGDERTDRIHAPDVSFGPFVPVPGDGPGHGVLLSFRSPARTREG